MNEDNSYAYTFQKITEVKRKEYVKTADKYKVKGKLICFLIHWFYLKEVIMHG